MTEFNCKTNTASVISFLLLAVFIVDVSGKSVCPLWHVKQMEKCKCIRTPGKFNLIECSKNTLFVLNHICLTWESETDTVRATYCLYAPIDYATCKQGNYKISTSISGPELNKWMCGRLNRQGVQCKQCISGYGPAALSDGVSCADCSNHRHLWILNLLLQLLLLTVVFMIILFLQIRGTASPWNIIITYSQLVVNALMYDAYLRDRIECYARKKVTTLVITILGFSNLDFFRLVIPPLCISSSLTAINTLFFDYIIALYPILMTLLVYALIELHDRNYKIIVVVSLPVRKLYHYFQGRWDPKQSILSTFATFLLLSYSKLLFVSCNFLFAVESYNSRGHIIPNSTVLLYDPNIKFFKSHHVPYIMIAPSVIITFILLPPLLLLLYPTHLFKRVLTCCGFRRWDILHMIMDTFQGWYKDGTEDTYDYRSFSAFYMILRVGIVGEFLTVIHLTPQGNSRLKWFVTGTLHVLLGILFLLTKPYKKQWMNFTDGLFLMVVGYLSLVLFIFL